MHICLDTNILLVINARVQGECAALGARSSAARGAWNMPKSVASWKLAFLVLLRTAFLVALAMPFLCVLVVGNLYAQVEKATLSGTVMDPSGAVIVDAKVQAKNVSTDATYSGNTDGQGRYSLPEMQVGTYDVSAEKTGFQR